MKSNLPHSKEKQVGGHKLTWHQWRPETSALRGAVFFLHGQGDYGERYQEIAEQFIAEGIAFTTCDLPGHGRSPGKRGHIPSLQVVKEASELGLREARELAGDKPVGFGGHSVGGLLALYLLGELQAPDFSWISSPLLKAEAGQAPWKPVLLRPLSRLLPTITLSTGVTADMCRQYLPGESAKDHLQFHNRISLSWGRELIDLSKLVRENPDRLPKQTPLLITQGGRDRICPPEFCQQFASTINRENFEFRFYPEARHEPFSDEQRGEVFHDLRQWLRQILSQ
ncbi:alpha/beta fold hydrolase [Roseibacillus persicicus]|uniref:alpha/beta fold hydrolase n=1 Tax=Roseibacillus persicicus TaxID=454148 RepID=UPI00398B1E34